MWEYTVLLTKSMLEDDGSLASSEYVLGVLDFSGGNDAWVHDAAIACFYTIADALVEYEVPRNLLVILPALARLPALLYGDYEAYNEDEHAMYIVSVTRHERIVL